MLSRCACAREPIITCAICALVAYYILFHTRKSQVEKRIAMATTMIQQQQHEHIVPDGVNSGIVGSRSIVKLERDSDSSGDANTSSSSGIGSPESSGSNTTHTRLSPSTPLDLHCSSHQDLQHSDSLFSGGSERRSSKKRRTGEGRSADRAGGKRARIHAKEPAPSTAVNPQSFEELQVILPLNYA